MSETFSPAAVDDERMQITAAGFSGTITEVLSRVRRNYVLRDPPEAKEAIDNAIVYIKALEKQLSSLTADQPPPVQCYGESPIPDLRGVNSLGEASESRLTAGEIISILRRALDEEQAQGFSAIQGARAAAIRKVLMTLGITDLPPPVLSEEQKLPRQPFEEEVSPPRLNINEEGNSSGTSGAGQP